MKNKIIAIIMTLIIVIIGIFIVLRVVDKPEKDKQNEIEVTDEIHKEAEEFAKKYNMSVEDVEKELTADLTEEQIIAYEQAKLDLAEPDIVEIIDDDPNDDKYIGIASDGTQYEVTDPILTLTDEEAQEYRQAVRDAVENGSENIPTVEEWRQDLEPGSSQDDQGEYKPTDDDVDPMTEDDTPGLGLGPLGSSGAPDEAINIIGANRTQEQIEKDIQATNEASEKSTASFSD